MAGSAADADDPSAVGRRCLVSFGLVGVGYLGLDVADYLLPGGLDVTIARFCMVVISVLLVRAFFLAWWWWLLRRRSRAGR